MFLNQRRKDTKAGFEETRVGVWTDFNYVQAPVAVSCEHSNKLSGYMKGV
jgi:hypothetical protein